MMGNNKPMNRKRQRPSRYEISTLVLDFDNRWRHLWNIEFLGPNHEMIYVYPSIFFKDYNFFVFYKIDFIMVCTENDIF